MKFIQQTAKPICKGQGKTGKYTSDYMRVRLNYICLGYAIFVYAYTFLSIVK